jgi:hypothetical protein
MNVATLNDLRPTPEMKVEWAAQALLNDVLAGIANDRPNRVLLSYEDLCLRMAGLTREEELAVERHPTFEVACALAATAQDADLSNSLPLQQVVAAWEKGLLDAGLPLYRGQRAAA